MGELLNHLGISKSFVTAIFVTSVALLVGPALLPSFFVPLEGLVKTGVTAAGIFSFTLIAAWVLPACVHALVSIPSAFRQSAYWNPPNDHEIEFLQYVGQASPNDWMSLEQMNHLQKSLLQLIEISRSLEEKGLVRLSTSEHSVHITPEGRRYVLKQIAN